MDLKEFIEETVKQIIDGVIAAQKHAETVKAEVSPSGSSQDVTFDVSVTVVEGKGLQGKAGLSVWSIGASGTLKSESVNTCAHRVRFSVPVIFPYTRSRFAVIPDRTE